MGSVALARYRVRLWAEGPPRYCLAEGRADVMRALAAWRHLARAEDGVAVSVSETVTHVLDAERTVVAVLTVTDP